MKNVKAQTTANVGKRSAFCNIGMLAIERTKTQVTTSKQKCCFGYNFVKQGKDSLQRCLLQKFLSQDPSWDLDSVFGDIFLQKCQISAFNNSYHDIIFTKTEFYRIFDDNYSMLKILISLAKYEHLEQCVQIKTCSRVHIFRKRGKMHRDSKNFVSAALVGGLGTEQARKI